MATFSSTESVTIAGTLTASGTVVFPTAAASWTNAIPTGANAQRALQRFLIPLNDARIHNQTQTLVTTAASDDLGINTGLGATYGTHTVQLVTSDQKANGGATSQYARWPQVQIPSNYDDGETAQIVVNAGMETTVSDTTAVVDVEAYKIDGSGAVTGGDLITTAAQSCNSLTAAEKTFTLDASSLDPNDIIDVRVTITINDGATVTAVYGAIGYVVLVVDCK